MRKLISNILLISTLLYSSSCITRVEKRGYMFDFADHHLLQEGVTSKERTLRIMGSPTIISDLGEDESWLYFYEKSHRLLFFYPTVKERNILVLRFDEENVIRELKSVTLEDQNSKLAINSKYTAVDSHKTGFFKSIFSNVGQVKPQ